MTLEAEEGAGDSDEELVGGVAHEILQPISLRNLEAQ
jgi:hypothetical protein